MSTEERERDRHYDVSSPKAQTFTITKPIPLTITIVHHHRPPRLRLVLLFGEIMRHSTWTEPFYIIMRKTQAEMTTERTDAGPQEQEEEEEAGQRKTT